MWAWEACWCPCTRGLFYCGDGSTVVLPSQLEPGKAIWTMAEAKPARTIWERSIESLSIWVCGRREHSARPGVKWSSVWCSTSRELGWAGSQPAVLHYREMLVNWEEHEMELEGIQVADAGKILFTNTDDEMAALLLVYSVNVSRGQQVAQSSWAGRVRPVVSISRGWAPHILVTSTGLGQFEAQSASICLLLWGFGLPGPVLEPQSKQKEPVLVREWLWRC